MKNFFGNGGAQAVAAQASAGKPLISGSAAMMLKGMGINPEEIDAIARGAIEAIQDVGTRLAAIEAAQAATNERLARIEAVCQISPAASDPVGDSYGN